MSKQSIISYYLSTKSVELAKFIARNITDVMSEPEFLTLSPSLLFPILEQCDLITIPDAVNVVKGICSHQKLSIDDVISRFPISDEAKKTINKIVRPLSKDDLIVTLQYRIKELETKNYELFSKVSQIENDIVGFFEKIFQRIKYLEDCDENTNSVVVKLKRELDELNKNQKMLTDHVLMKKKRRSSLVSDRKGFYDSETKNYSISFIDVPDEGGFSLNKHRHSGGVRGTSYSLHNYQPRLDDVYSSNDRPVLHRAAQEGDFGTIINLLCQGKDCDERDENGNTPLHVASQYGNTDVCVSLLSKECRINSKDKNGLTPLHKAVRHNQKDVTTLLLDNDAKINEPDKDGNTPLCYACRYGYVDLVEVLIGYEANTSLKCNDGYGPLHYAARYGHDDVCKLLLFNGIDIDSREATGATALLLACRYGNKSVIDVLVSKGASLSVVDNDGYSALHMAALSGDVDVCATILTFDIDINMKTYDNYSAIDLAIEEGHLDIANILSEKGAERSRSVPRRS